MSRKSATITIRPMVPADREQIVEMGRLVYPRDTAYTVEHFNSMLRVFPQGQLVAVDDATQHVVGYALSLIVNWDDYQVHGNWDSFTDAGYFTNHDPGNGRTLYGADIVVHPDTRGQGVGRLIYKARFDLCRELGLLRIRAGARLRGYHRYAKTMSPQDYTIRVIRGELKDATLSFQIKQGFRVIAVAENYLSADPESRGHAAVIEWMNHKIATRRDYAKRPPIYAKPRGKSNQNISDSGTL